MIDTDDKTTLAAAVTDQSAVTRWDIERILVGVLIAISCQRVYRLPVTTGSVL